MQSLVNEPSTNTTYSWPKIAPLLDSAIARLNDQDRHAIILRYFKNRSLAEVGHALGAKEDAARMRVNRALEKLRQFFAKRGVSSTTAILAGAISANSVQAAPAGLAHSTIAVAVTKGAAMGSSTLTLVKGALKLMAWTQMKTVVVIGVTVALAAGTVVVGASQQSTPPTPALPVAPRTNPPPALPSGGQAAIHFENVSLTQVLEVYKKVSGLELTIAPEVKRLNAGINLRVSRVDGPMVTKLLEQALLDQAGVVITKNGRTATATYNGSPTAQPQNALPTPPGPTFRPK